MASLAHTNPLRVPSGWLTPADKVELHEEIGRGAFGTVHRGMYQNDIVAIKKIHSGANQAQRDAAAKALRKEIQALTRVHHKNVVVLLGACEDPPMLIMVHADKGTLRQLLDDPHVSLSLDERLKLITGV